MAVERKETTKQIIDLAKQLKNALDSCSEAVQQNIDNLFQNEEMSYEEFSNQLSSDLKRLNTSIKNKSFDDKTVYDTRKEIINLLDKIGKIFQPNPNYSRNSVHNLSAFKRLHSMVNTPFVMSKEKFKEWEKEVLTVSSLHDECEANLVDLKEMRSKASLGCDSISKQKEQSSQLLNNLKDQVDNASSDLKALDSLIEEATQLRDSTQEVNKTIEDNRKSIADFCEKLAIRETQIEDQKTITNEYSDKLTNFENEKNNYLQEAERMITEAKQALNYRSAQGLSAALSNQYKTAKGKWRNSTLLWISMALILLGCSVGIGFWIMIYEGSTQFLISRVALMPVFIAGAWFCANQYTKQKSIIEDYAYKMTLAKSFVGFSEEIRKHGDDYEDKAMHADYVKNFIQEIHKHPLRNIRKENTEIAKLLNSNSLSKTVKDVTA